MKKSVLFVLGLFASGVLSGQTTPPEIFPHCLNDEDPSRICPECPEEDSLCEGSEGTATNSGNGQVTTHDAQVGGALGTSISNHGMGRSYLDGNGVGPVNGGMPLAFERIGTTRIATQNYLEGRFGQGGAWVHNYSYSAYDETDSNDKIGIAFSLPTGREVHFRWSASQTQWLISSINTESGALVTRANLPYSITVAGSDYTLTEASGKKYLFKRIPVPGSSPTTYFYRIDRVTDVYGHNHIFGYDTAASADPASVTDGTGSKLIFTYNTVASAAVERVRFDKRVTTSGMTDLRTENYSDERLPGLVDTNAATLGAWMSFEITDTSSIAAIPACQMWAVFTTNRGASSVPLAIGEIELYDETGAIITGGTAFGSPGVDTSHEAAKVRDNIATNAADLAAANCWRPSFQRNAYCGVDFGTLRKKVRKVRLWIPDVPGVTRISGAVRNASFQIVGMQSGLAQPQKVLAQVVGRHASAPTEDAVSLDFTYAEQGDGIFGRVNLDDVYNNNNVSVASNDYYQIRPYTRNVLSGSYDTNSKSSVSHRAEFYTDGSLGTVWKNYAGDMQNGVGNVNLLRTTLTAQDASHPIMTTGNKAVRYSMNSGTGYSGAAVTVSNGNVRKKEFTTTANSATTTTQKFFTYHNSGAGFLATKRDQNGNLTEYARDSFGRATSIKTYDGAPLLQNSETTFSGPLVTQKKVTNYRPDGTSDIRITDYAYTAGQLSSITYPTDAMNRRAVESWTYSSLPGSLEKVIASHTFSDGSVESWARNPTTGLVTSHTNRHGATTTYAQVYGYSPTITTTDPFSFTSSVWTNGDQTIATNANSRDDWMSGFPGSFGAEYSFSDVPGVGALNGRWIYKDDLRRVVKTEDDLGRITLTEYESPTGGGGCGCNSGANPTLITAPDGSKTRFYYDGAWRRTAMIVAADTTQAVRTDYEYDSVGNLTKEYLPYAGGTTRPTNHPYTEHTYDGNNRRKQTVKPGNLTTSWQFDGVGNVLKETRPDGSYTTNTYDGRDRLISSIVSHQEMVNGVPTWVNDSAYYEYDVEGRLTKTTSPMGKISTRQYSVGGLLRFETSGVGTVDAATTEYQYDKGRLWKKIAPDAKLTTYAYDSMGAVSQVTDSAGRTTITLRDAFSRVAQVTLPDTTTTKKGYDALGYGRLLWDEDQNGAKTSYDYDLAGRLITLTDPKNSVRQWQYNLRGQLITKIWPDTTTDSYNYTGAGLLLNHTAPTGVVETYAYDAVYRLSSRTWSGGPVSAPPPIVYTYDSLGRASTISRQDGAYIQNQVTYTYDGLSRKKSEALYNSISATTRTVTTAYDADEQISKLTYPDGTVNDYNYTARGQLKQVLNGGPPPVGTYTYDLAGRVTGLAMENGVNTAISHQPTTGQISTITHSKAGSTLEQVGYTLNPQNDRRTGVARSNGWNDTYSYDHAGQVTSRSSTTGSLSESFAYDAAGNRTAYTENSTTVNSVADNLDQYWLYNGNYGGGAVTHDNNGNLTSISLRQMVPLAATPLDFTWTVENLLMRSTKWNATKTQILDRVENTFDALQRRIAKQHYDAAGNLLKQSTFVYDGWNVVEENETKRADASSAWTSVTRRYTWGADVSGTMQGAGGVGGLLMAEEIVGSSAPVAHYYHYDGNGNVLAITDANGTVEGQYRYNAFGSQTSNTATVGTYAATQPYRFSTKYLDDELGVAGGLYYYGYRFYSAEMGRWLNRDPLSNLRWESDTPLDNETTGGAIFFEGETNIYQFLRNDGLGKTDYLGLADNSVTATIEACMKLPTAAQRAECLESLAESTDCLTIKAKIENMGRTQRFMATEKFQRMGKTAEELIGSGSKGVKGFPGDKLGKTYKEILKAAKDGEEWAKKLKKLIEQAGRLGDKGNLKD